LALAQMRVRYVADATALLDTCPWPCPVSRPMPCALPSRCLVAFVGVPRPVGSDQMLDAPRATVCRGRAQVQVIVAVSTISQSRTGLPRPATAVPATAVPRPVCENFLYIFKAARQAARAADTAAIASAPAKAPAAAGQTPVGWRDNRRPCGPRSAEKLQGPRRI